MSTHLVIAPPHPTSRRQGRAQRREERHRLERCDTLTSVRSQLVRRTLDLTWHTLQEDPRELVRWCPGPDVRLLRLLDLTRWNDAPGRTQEEVIDLLVTTQHTADVQRELCRAELSGVGIASEACAQSPTPRQAPQTY